MSSSACLAASAITWNVSVVSSGSTAASRWPALGLHDHDADRVGDDVVQLGRDPSPLVADGQLRVRLALLRQLGGALLQPPGDDLVRRIARPAPQKTAGNMTVGTQSSALNACVRSAAKSATTATTPATRPA